jgi:hypothetical protein
MRPKTRKVEKLSRVLTEPVVRFVSLVTHAATQQPFKFLKAAKVEAMAQENEVVTINSDITRPTSGDDVLLQKIEFPASKYDMLKASEYAKKLGFEDFTTEKDGERIIVKSVYFEQFNEDVATIRGEDNGVVMHVGTIKSAEQLEAEQALVELEDKVLKSLDKVPHLKGVEAEVLQKYDPYVSWWSDETDLGDMITDGMYDGLPIGAPEISSAYWSVVANATRSGDMEAIRKASNDMGNLIIALWDLYSGLATSSDDLEILAMSKEAQERLVQGSEAADKAATEEAVVTKEADGIEAQEVASDVSDENKESDGVVGEDGGESNSVEEEAPKPEAKDLGELLKEALAPLTEQVATMSKTIEAQEKQIKSLEGSAIQRRGVETNGEEGAKVKSAQEQEEDAVRQKAQSVQAEKNIRNLLGL